MITQAEYDKAQILLGSKGKPRTKKYYFPFTGLIRCGECGAMITADEKNQIICSVCKHKFSSNNKTVCPKCGVLIENMEDPTILHYVYYHCTKRKNPECSQRSVEVKNLEGQIREHLSRIHISEHFKDWAIGHLKEESEKEIQSREMIISSQRNAYDNCLKKIDNLLQLKISPMNAGGSLLSDEEYAKRKVELMKEKSQLQEMLDDADKGVERWLKIAEETFNFACYAKYWFENGTDQDKANILKSLGSNLILKDRELKLDLKKSLIAVENVVKGVPQVKAGFEPEKNGLNKRNLDAFYAQNPVVQGALDEVRTYLFQQVLSGAYNYERLEYSKAIT